MIFNKKEEKIKKLIKDNHVEYKVPDLKEQIKAEYLKNNLAENIEHQPKKKKISLPRFFIPSLATVLGCATLFVVIFSTTGQVHSSISNSSSNNNQINYRNQELAYSLISSSLTLNDNSKSSNLKLRKSSFTTSETEEELQRINKFMPTIESLLSNNLIYDISIVESDLSSYQYKMITNQTLIDGEQIITTTYFNETDTFYDITENSEIKHENSHHDWFDDDEVEETYIIEGIFIDSNNNSLPFSTCKVVEKEDDEIETEFTTLIYLDEAKSEFVKVEEEQEIEDNEMEHGYKYSYYKMVNNKSDFSDRYEKIEEVEIEFNEDKNKPKVKLEFDSDIKYNTDYEITLNSNIFSFIGKTSPLDKFNCEVNNNQYHYYNDKFDYTLSRNY